MLALIDTETEALIKTIIEYDGMSTEDMLSSYGDDWQGSDCVLVAVEPLADDSIPDGKVFVSQSVEIEKIESVWTAKIVRVLADTPRPSTSDVNAERDRRIAAGFTFNGKAYAMDDQSKARISGAATLAGFAAITGAGAGNYRWADANVDFVWIANDNTLTLMDAPTCFAFGKAAAAWESQNIFAARAIKESDPVPYGFTNNAYWPNS
ncbi:hypothetical protein [Mesorhizobium sp. M0586]|uniref:DUF4376 domain-containing protein n=1 Tax=unclassified Mesorhizobium TaxID=325217 RepID=UPI003334E8A8